MKKITAFLLLSVCFLSSCGSYRAGKLFSSGEVVQQKFRVEIPFEYRMRLIILKVEIDGETYDFVLDTGAPNVISQELAKKLNLKAKLRQKVGDSQGKRDKLDFVKVNEMSINGLSFKNTGAVVADLQASTAIGCLNISGFIGANLMRKALWHFDFDKQVIVVANSLDSLHLQGEQHKVSFLSRKQGTPVCSVQVNDTITEKVIVDFGSNSGIDLSKKAYKSLKEQANEPLIETYKYGSSSSGLYGRADADTNWFVKCTKAQIGEVMLDNPIIEFGAVSHTLGIDFFKHYEVVLNWFDNEMTLIKRSTYDTTLTDFGVSVYLRNDTLEVAAILKGSSADKAGIQIGDHITSINGENVEPIDVEKYCNLLLNKDEKANKRTLNIRRGKEIFEHRLTKDVILR